MNFAVFVSLSKSFPFYPLLLIFFNFIYFASACFHFNPFVNPSFQFSGWNDKYYIKKYLTPDPVDGHRTNGARDIWRAIDIGGGKGP